MAGTSEAESTVDGSKLADEALASVELEAADPVATGATLSLGPVDVEPLAPPVADGFAALPSGFPAVEPPATDDPELGRTEPEAEGDPEPEPVGKPAVSEPAEPEMGAVRTDVANEVGPPEAECPAEAEAVGREPDGPTDEARERIGIPEASIAMVLTTVVTETGMPAVPPMVSTMVIVEYLTVVDLVAGKEPRGELDEPVPAEGAAVTTDVSTDAGALPDAGGGLSFPGAADEPGPPGPEGVAGEPEPEAPAEVTTVINEGDAEPEEPSPEDDPDPAGEVPDGPPTVTALVTTEGPPSEGAPEAPGADTITEITPVVSEPGMLDGPVVPAGTLALGAPGVTMMVVTRGGSVPPGLPMVVTMVIGGAGAPGAEGSDGAAVALGAPIVVTSVTGGTEPDTAGSEDGKGGVALGLPRLVTTVLGGDGAPVGTLELGENAEDRGEEGAAELGAPGPSVAVTTSGGIDIGGIDMDGTGSPEGLV